MATTKQNSVELLIRARDETQRAIRSAKSGLESFAAAQAKTTARRNQIATMENDALALAGAYRTAADQASALGKKIGDAKRPSKALRDEFAAVRTQVKGLRSDAVEAAAALGRTTGQVGKRGSFAQFDQGIVARQGADQAAEGVNRFARALELAAANQQRLDRISRADHFSRTANGARSAQQATNAFGDALSRIAAYQQRKANFAQFDHVASGARRAEVAVEGETLALNANTAALGRNAAVTRGRGGAGIGGRVEDAYTSKQGRGPLGLRPYEMQNLGYQINDVFTQLGSGTPPMQVFAQQAGQIVQIFPGLISGFVRWAPVIGLVTAALSPFISEMNKANSEAETLKEFDLLLTRSGEAASYTAPKLAAVAENLDAYSGSLKEARASLNEFVGDSVAPEYLERFGKVALDFSKVMKVDVTDAAKTVSDAFTGNADAILALDDELNFLTDSERAHIKVLRESKKDAEARTYAFGIFEKKYGATADKMRGPWSQILKDFGAAWEAFSDYVNMIDFKEAGRRIDNLIKRIQLLTRLLPGANKATLESARATRMRNAEEIERIEDGGPRVRAQNNVRLAFLRRENAELWSSIERMSNAEAGRDILGGAINAPADTTLDPPAPANTDKPKKSDAEKEAERLAKLQAEFNEDLEAQNHARLQDIRNLRETERELAIIEAIEDARAKAADQHITFTDAQANSIRDSVGALHDAKKITDALKATDRARLELAEARNDVEARSVAIARQLKEAGFDPGTIKDLTDVLMPGNIDLANRPTAVNPDGSISTVRSISIEVDGQVALIPTVGPDGNVLSDDDAIKLFEDTGDHLGIFATLEAAEKYAEQLHHDQEVYYSDQVQNLKEILGLTWDINEATRQKDEAEKTVNDLVALRSTMQERVEFLDESGEGTQADLLREQIVLLDAEIVKAANDAILLMQALGGPGSEAAIAKLQTIRDTAAGLGQNAIASGKQINEMLAQGATNAFDQFAQSLAEGENAISAMGDAFLQFAADFLRQIAMMILQQIILNALQAMGGGTGGAGGGAGGFLSNLIGSIFGGIKKHSGGMVGSAGAVSVPAHAFNQALRYHGGGVMGLKPNEVPIIGLRGEEVLTEDDPRHRYNGGLNGGQPASVKVVNVLDPADLFDRALASDEGERTFFNFVRRNSAALKAAMG